tara:strand:- start:1084 stop:1338 length:255 start_codon:yes stop_codon:yes gene_type:complete
MRFFGQPLAFGMHRFEEVSQKVMLASSQSSSRTGQSVEDAPSLAAAVQQQIRNASPAAGGAASQWDAPTGVVGSAKKHTPSLLR